MLTVLSAGLPISAKDILKDAMNKVFDGAIAIQELTKENLRSRVRLSSRSVEIVLVILDGVSSDMCSDIEGGLYQSDKYYTYVNDKEFVNFLNNKYGLDMVIEDDIEEVAPVFEDSTLSSEDEKYYLEKIKSKEDTIQNLECRIKELTELYGLVDDEISKISTGEVEELRDENISLNNKVLDLESTVEARNVKIADLESTLDRLKEDKVLIENRLKKVSKNYDELVSELNELKVLYSNQSGLIRSKDTRIAELEKKQSKYDITILENKELKELSKTNKSIIANKDIEIGNLKVDLQSKEKDIVRYTKEVESLRGLESVSEELKSANSTIDSLKVELSSTVSENSTLRKDIKEKDRVISQLSDSNEENSNKIEELLAENEELNERIKSDDESLFELNKEKIELQNKIMLLEKSVDSNNDTESLLLEIQDLQGKLSTMSSNIFNNIGMYALPNGTINCKILNDCTQYKNIKFAFAGSAESRRGVYKCLLDEFKGKDDSRYLIVDLVSETSIDYVFKIKKVIPGIEWFRKGGSVQQYISSTELRNTQVLSLGLGYINDSYFLCIDWSKRLRELENSGYKVILFCGDISNLVGRVLHESFASYGDSIIYVLGNSVSSRALVTNLRGLSNKGDSIVAYFDFNPAIQRFYEMVAKSNECKILSTKNKR